MRIAPPPPPPSSRARSLADVEGVSASPTGSGRVSRGGALKAFLLLLAGVAAIAAGVTAVWLVTGGDRSAVKVYVTLLREKKNSEAYAMLAGARKGEFSPDAFPQKLHTPLLANSTDVDITSSSRSSPGKSCVTASVEEPAGKHTVHFYVVEENGAKVIHSVFTADDLGAGGLASVEPWHCD